MNTQTYWNKDTYFWTILKLRQDHINLVYTDETWVNTHHNEYIWVDSDWSGGWKVPSRGDDTYNYTRQ